MASLRTGPLQAVAASPAVSAATAGSLLPSLSQIGSRLGSGALGSRMLATPAAQPRTMPARSTFQPQVGNDDTVVAQVDLPLRSAMRKTFKPGDAVFRVTDPRDATPRSEGAPLQAVNAFLANQIFGDDYTVHDVERFVRFLGFYISEDNNRVPRYGQFGKRHTTGVVNMAIGQRAREVRNVFASTAPGQELYLVIKRRTLSKISTRVTFPVAGAQGRVIEPDLDADAATKVWQVEPLLIDPTKEAMPGYIPFDHKVLYDDDEITDKPPRGGWIKLGVSDHVVKTHPSLPRTKAATYDVNAAHSLGTIEVLMSNNYKLRSYD